MADLLEAADGVTDHLIAALLDPRGQGPETGKGGSESAGGANIGQLEQREGFEGRETGEVDEPGRIIEREGQEQSAQRRAAKNIAEVMRSFEGRNLEREQRRG